MHLYEINGEILALLEQLEPDPETGEIPANEAEILDQIRTLVSRREDMLQYLAKLVLDYRAASAALKAEEARLHRRRDTMDLKADRLMRVLDRECCGQNTDLGVATLRYRKTSRLELSDEAQTIAWLKEHGCMDAINVPAPTVYKGEVKKLLSAGHDIPGCQVVTEHSCSLR